MKDIKDYLPLYYGCIAISTLYSTNEKMRIDEISKYTMLAAEKGFIKLVLRPLSDMTEEEWVETCRRQQWATGSPKFLNEGTVMMMNIKPDCFTYLLSHGFDIFGLIEENLAINKTTIK